MIIICLIIHLHHNIFNIWIWTVQIICKLSIWNEHSFVNMFGMDLLYTVKPVLKKSKDVVQNWAENDTRRALFYFSILVFLIVNFLTVSDGILQCWISLMRYTNRHVYGTKQKNIKSRVHKIGKSIDNKCTPILKPSKTEIHNWKE